MKSLPQRKSPRLKDYDYAQEGAYFLTICIQNRFHLLGHIDDQIMKHTPAGHMVMQFWLKLSEKYADIGLDFWVVMPNHFHGILVINRYENNTSQTSIPDVMKWFKTMTTNAYIRGVKSDGWQRFDKRLWQHSYHDRIIRNESELNDIREYVQTNPARWEADTFYE